MCLEMLYRRPQARLPPPEDKDAVESCLDSSPNFRLLTTLRYDLFLSRDVCEAGDYFRDETERLLAQWEPIKEKLLELHRIRLYEAADEHGWPSSTLFSGPLVTEEEYPNRKQDAQTAARSAAVSGHAKRNACTNTRVEMSPVLRQAVARAARMNYANSGVTLSDDEADEVVEKDQLISPPTILEDAIEKAARTMMSSHQLPDFDGKHMSLRVRILLSNQNSVQIEVAPLPGVTSSPARVLQQQIDMYTRTPFTLSPDTSKYPKPSRIQIAKSSTEPSRFTRRKTTYRKPYDDARAHATPPLLPKDPPTMRELLLFNPSNQIMEASLSAVYFYQGGKWVTPHRTCGGVSSVTNMYSLDEGWCEEGVITKESVKPGELIWLSNAVRGFFPGVVED
jgi:hypothetical protein